MKPSFEYLDVAISEIVVPAEFVREESSKVDDDILAKSIREGGVQQPLVLLRDGDGYRLVKGSRRLAVARALGLPRVPAVVDTLPDGEQIDDYARRLRFILDEHRQDLMPSQRAALIEKMKETLGLSSKQVAAYLGVDQDSITNWLAIRRYTPSIVKAMDSGALTQKSARVFDGMTPAGQDRVWQLHGEMLCAGAGDVHKELRAKYPPEQFPAFYRNPERIAARLERKAGTRKSKGRVDYSAAEKKRLMHSVDMKEAEIAEFRAEAKELKKEIDEATPVIRAIIANKKLWAMVPESMRAELERFGEVYV